MMSDEQTSTVALAEREVIYVGFWLRVWAYIIDTVLLMIIVLPMLWSIYGMDYFLPSEDMTGQLIMENLVAGPANVLISYVLPLVIFIIFIWFWIYYQATPGKMLIGAKIVDATTGERPSTLRFLIRYLGYFLSFSVLFLGVLWVAVDKRKQGWHDKFAGTVVIKTDKHAQ